MPQGNPSGYLLPELMGERSQDEGLGDLRALAQNPTEDFLVSLLEFADRYGILDSAMAPQAGEAEFEDRTGALDDEDITKYLSREELQLLMDKFEAIPPEQQKAVLDTVREASPETYRSLLARYRLVRGRNNIAQERLGGQP